MADRNRQVLLELMQQPGNKACGDCKAENDDGWASCSLGVFLCQNCASMHRNLGVDFSRVKSIRLDNWEDDQVQKMAATGNERANEQYEQYLPLYYKRPTSDDANVLRNQFARAKYQRKEFMYKEKQGAYSGPMKEGYLMKKAKRSKEYCKRKFVLSSQENSLVYYTPSKNNPKDTIRLDDINAVFVPDKTGNPNGLQITYLKNGSTRSIYIYIDDPKEIVDWYTAIRAAKFERRKIAFPATDETELAKDLTTDFISEGYLHKAGPNKQRFRKRWFTLDWRKLMYFDQPLSSYPLGEVFIGHRDARYEVSDAQSPIKAPGWSFTLHTPSRIYYMSADSFEDQQQWMTALQKIVEIPLTPQDIRLNSQLKG